MAFLRLSSSETVFERFTHDVHGPSASAFSSDDVGRPSSSELPYLNDPDDIFEGSEGEEPPPPTFETLPLALLSQIFFFCSNPARTWFRLSLLSKLLRQRINHSSLEFPEWTCFHAHCQSIPRGVVRAVRKVHMVTPDVSVVHKIGILRYYFPFLGKARVDLRTGGDVKALLHALGQFPASFYSMTINCLEGGKVGATCLAKALCLRVSLRELMCYGVDFFLSEKSSGEKSLSKMSSGRSAVEKLILSSRRLSEQVFHTDDKFDVLGVFQNPFVTALKNEVRVRIFKKRAANISRNIAHLIGKLGMLRTFTFDGADEESYLIDFGRVAGSHSLRSLIVKGATVDMVAAPLRLFPNLDVWRVEECKLLHFNRMDSGFILHDNLKDLSISDNSALFDDYPLCFECFPNLERLKLTSNNIPDFSMDTKLPTNERIKHLDFSYNAIHGEGYFKMLVRNQALEALIVESNPIDFTRGADFWESMTLTELNVSKTSCGLVGLITALTDFPRLRILSASRAQILFEEGDELPFARSMRFLDICSNKIGERGFVQVVTRLPYLERLCAAQCDISIGDQFTAAVSAPIRLRDVSLSLNYITTDGLEALLPFIPDCVYLDMLSNRIKARRFSLPAHDNLRVCLLALNQISADDIPHVFRHHPMLRVVMLGSSKDDVATLYYPVLKSRH